MRHYEEVARAAGGTGIIVYNISSRTTVNLDPELLAELAQIDGIDAVKQSNSAELGRSTDDAADGNDEDLARCLDVAARAIHVSSHIVGSEMRRIFDEPERRAEIHGELLARVSAMYCTASPIPSRRRSTSRP